MARPDGLVEERQRARREARGRPSRPARTAIVGRQPRLDLAVLGLDGDDLRGAEILGAEDRRRAASKRRRSGYAPAARRGPARLRRGPPATRGTAMSAPLTRTRRGPFRQAGAEVEEVHRRRADEVGDEHRRRPVVDLLRRAELLDHAVVHHRDLVGHRHRLELVVGDVDGGRVDAVVQLAQFAHHEIAELGVERAERLVHQEGHRPAHDGAAERDALAVAAGKPRDRLVEQMVDAQEARRLLDALARSPAAACPGTSAGSRCSGARSCAGRARRAGRRRRCRARRRG